MYTLSLDEYGNFEGYKPEKKDAIFIGGVIFDDGDYANELKIEKKRIRSFYLKVVDDVSKANGVELKYPRCLHVDNNNEASNENVAKIKNKITEKLPEFLRVGTYNNEILLDKNGKELPERKGRYYIYTILKSDEGKKKRLSDGSEFLLRDNHASNLYFHMAMDTIGRTIFYNPYADRNAEFDLHIATRSTQTFANDSQEAKMYQALGYTGKDFSYSRGVKNFYTVKNRKGDSVPAIRFELTNKDIYRTAISLFAADNNPQDVQVKNLSVEDIRYNVDGKDRNFKYEMLYLADTVCSYLQFKLANDTTRLDASAWLVELYSRASILLPEDQQLIFAYDDIDIQFMKALEYLKTDNYYAALRTSFLASDKQDEFSLFYKKHWFPFIQRAIAKSDNYDAFSKAVADLYQSLFSNHYDSQMGIYILEVLELEAEIIKANLNTREGHRNIAKLYEVAMTIYCHLGDSMNAEKYYELLTKNYSDLVKIDDMLRLKDMLSVCYSDCFSWDKALKLSTKTVKMQHQLSEIRKSIQNTEDNVYIAEGKSLSQLAQIYAFCRDRKAEGYFLRALELYQKESADYFITLSYLLHYYLDNGNKVGFESYAEEYFSDAKSLEDKLDYIITEGLKEDAKISLKFALYVYIRYIHTFKLDVHDSLWEKLIDIEKYINTKKDGEAWKLRGHPKELIYKYIVLIAISRKDMEIASKYLEELKQWPIYSFNAVSAIISMSICQIEEEMKNEKEWEKQFRKLKKELIENITSFKELDKENDLKKSYEQVKNYFVYMYN